MTIRPAIPEPIKREVRQACGFGCVICGAPIYQIDHIIDYAIVQKHEAENLVLLCGTHHQFKTNGWLSEQTIREHKAHPINGQTGISAPFNFDIISDEVRIWIGGNLYSKQFVSLNDISYPIVVNDKALITLRKEGPKILFSFSVYNKDGVLILVIEENEVVFSIDVWDVQIVGLHIMINTGPRKKVIEIDFDLDARLIAFTAGDYYFANWNIKITRDELKVIDPTNDSKAFSGIAMGDNLDDAPFGFVASNDPINPVNVGLMLGDCPSFEKYRCLMQVK